MPTDALLRAAGSGDAVERRTAIVVLARHRVAAGRAAMVRLLDDPVAEVRVAAVVALGELGEEADRARLQGLLQSSDQATARAAAKALYRGRKPGYGPPSDIARMRRERANLAGRPVTQLSVDAAFRYALPEIRTYAHQEITERIAAVCSDYSATRRYAVEEGVLERSGDEYRLTELGAALWRVEHHIVDHYLGRQSGSHGAVTGPGGA